jgi:hypothetical protein
VCSAADQNLKVCIRAAVVRHWQELMFGILAYTALYLSVTFGAKGLIVCEWIYINIQDYYFLNS